MMGSLAPERVIGVHVNGGRVRLQCPASDVSDEDLAIDDRSRARQGGTGAGLGRREGRLLQASGHPTADPRLRPRPTRPPGSWRGSWRSSRSGRTPPSELPDDAVPRDRLLANVAVYWFTRTATSSANLYYETSARPGAAGRRRAVPTGVAVFAADLAIRRYGEQPVTTSPTGATSTPAGTSPRWRRRSCSSRTSGRSSRR